MKLLKLVLIIFLIMPAVSCGKKKPAGINAKITQFVGLVSVNGKGVTSADQNLAYNDIITTGEKSFCEIIINEKNILRINAKTQLQFKISDKENTLQLDSGWLAGVTKEKFTSQGLFLIKTPTATAAVRGTSFCTKVEDADKTYFCVCNGKIEFINKGETSGEFVDAPHHAAMRFTKKPDGTIEIDKNPGLKYHDDKGVETLAKTINVTIDWTKSDSK